MVNGTSITNADDRRLIELSNDAKERLVYLAPGISLGLAEALSSAWERLGADAVTVILDVDPDVCRLGYGSLEGLQRLRQGATRSGSLVCHQPGVRIGLLISDETTLIYSPTPLLLEAGSGNPERPNAVELKSTPQEVARDVGLGSEPDLQRRIGLDPIKPDQIDKVSEDLKAAPPLKFDLARRVRVFTSRFQFAELEMSGCYISRRKVPIPSSLMGLARNRDVASQLHTHFNLIQKGQIDV